MKRIYIHESIYEKFRAALVNHVKTFKVGVGTEEDVTHGPLQNSMQYEKVRGIFDEIEAK